MIKKVKILDQSRIGDGKFLQLQQARVQFERSDGTVTGEGTYEYLDRAVGRDAVVVVLWRHAGATVEVLIRRGLRMPLLLRGTALTSTTVELDPEAGYTRELVAGIIEPDEEAELSIAPHASALGILQTRARAEAEEEAGIALPLDRFRPIGELVYPSTGVFAERLFFLQAQVHADETQSATLSGDGSIFEEGATLQWWPLDAAISACMRGAISDLKTEVGLRRLRDHLSATT